MPRGRLRPNEKLLQIRITEQQRRDLRVIAAHADTDVSRLVRMVLARFIDEQRGILLAGTIEPKDDST